MCSQVREAHPHRLPGSEYSGLLRCRCGLQHSDDDGGSDGDVDGDNDVDDLLCKWQHCDVVWVQANYDSDNDGINDNNRFQAKHYPGAKQTKTFKGSPSEDGTLIKVWKEKTMAVTKIKWIDDFIFYVQGGAG